MPAAIEFRDVVFRTAQGRLLLDQISFAVEEGTTTAILGRSGSGKTTLLRTVNRMVEPTSGDVLVNSESVRDYDLIELRRSVGYVIQETGLFPHFTVEHNVGLVPTIEGWAGERIRERVHALLRLVGLDSGFASRYPAELSGGQRQRVGVARALAADPPILLMDEPFGALDPITRSELQREFRRLQGTLGKTVVFVTHELSEALLLASRIALVEAGRLEGLYTPEEFLRSPDPAAVAYREAFRPVLPPDLRL